MKHKIGDQLYSKSEKYDDGKICDKRNKKYIIDTGINFIEVNEPELELNFYWILND